ncbi:hypothetical protein RRF57_003010 [Xylaria bambusicola]|uniref:rRNA 2'-O-methyltransferase fibrillarin n=1 Tax=Xylaria bambusicola TaxID=326684 RepID=A0AAN7U819_9PEZI
MNGSSWIFYHTQSISLECSQSLASNSDVLDLLTRSIAPGIEVVSVHTLKSIEIEARENRFSPTANPLQSELPINLLYGEKRISVDEVTKDADGASVTTKVEYRIWNPFRSKLAAAVIGGIDNIFIAPGKKVLYLGAASGTSVSHVADIVGPTGNVYAVEFSHRSGRDLTTMAQNRTNVIPIVEDARHPLKYRMLVPMVDAIFLDVAQPDQARIALLNASLFLKIGGGIVISIKANCIDSTAAPEAVFAAEVQKLRAGGLKPLEQLTLGMCIHVIHDYAELTHLQSRTSVTTLLIRRIEEA